jgi:hypothetical protein
MDRQRYEENGKREQVSYDFSGYHQRFLQENYGLAHLHKELPRTIESLTDIDPIIRLAGLFVDIFFQML